MIVKLSNGHIAIVGHWAGTDELEEISKTRELLVDNSVAIFTEEQFKKALTDFLEARRVNTSDALESFVENTKAHPEGIRETTDVKGSA